MYNSIKKIINPLFCFSILSLVGCSIGERNRMHNGEEPPTGNSTVACNAATLAGSSVTSTVDKLIDAINNYDTTNDSSVVAIATAVQQFSATVYIYTVDDFYDAINKVAILPGDSCKKDVDLATFKHAVQGLITAIDCAGSELVAAIGNTDDQSAYRVAKAIKNHITYINKLLQGLDTIYSRYKQPASRYSKKQPAFSMRAYAIKICSTAILEARDSLFKFMRRHVAHKSNSNPAAIAQAHDPFAATIKQACDAFCKTNPTDNNPITCLDDDVDSVKKAATGFMHTICNYAYDDATTYATLLAITRFRIAHAGNHNQVSKNDKGDKNGVNIFMDSFKAVCKGLADASNKRETISANANTKRRRHDHT